MAEYIERDALLDAIINDHPDLVFYSKQEAIECIVAEPAADVVEVVRCKDCKWFFQDADNEPCCRNVCGLVIVTDEDFCSLGERRKDK